MLKQKNNFWEAIPLAQMTKSQWESLCDGCGRCCLNKLEDEHGNIYFTDIACRLLDENTCRCRRYENRTSVVPDCLIISLDKPQDFRLLPDTCAYRLLAENKPLPSWHPLITGRADSVHRAGISVRDKCISEQKVPRREWEAHVIKLTV